jgi:hypothetical protein
MKCSCKVHARRYVKPTLKDVNQQGEGPVLNDAKIVRRKGSCGERVVQHFLTGSPLDLAPACCWSVNRFRSRGEHVTQLFVGHDSLNFERDFSRFVRRERTIRTQHKQSEGLEGKLDPSMGRAHSPARDKDERQVFQAAGASASTSRNNRNAFEK